MEKRTANRCQAWIAGSCIADFPYPIRHIALADAAFCPVAQKQVRSSGAGGDLLSLHPLFLPHRFLARVDTIMLFFLSRKKQGVLIMTEHQLSLLPFYAG
ncbi:MAG TPA: hypothetical protein VHZ51_15875 [Ktedonobacteraceae bacterium]|nr:hypothetical protein [Ktedonobacteraceae bacterium]